MLDEQKFKKLADDALNLLNRELIAASDDYGFEVDFNAGALGVEFEDPPAKFVIRANRWVKKSICSDHAHPSISADRETLTWP
jgi:frataxin-like iron-binding protein CyaY